MSKEQETVFVFKALSDENRIRILKLLCRGQMCACMLLEELDISQPTLSHHMKILCDVGIVTGHRVGKWMYYSICTEGVQVISGLMEELLAAKCLPVECNCKEG